MKCNNGFTLIELLVAISISAILIALAIPSFASFITNNINTMHMDQFISSIQTTRSEALKLNARVSMCPSINGSSCSDSNDWTTGWLIFKDVGGENGKFDANDKLIKVYGRVANQISITANSESKYIQFLSSGYTSNYSNVASPQMEFIITPENCEGNNSKEIQLARYGHLAYSKKSCS